MNESLFSNESTTRYQPCPIESSKVVIRSYSHTLAASQIPQLNYLEFLFESRFWWKTVHHFLTILGHVIREESVLKILLVESTSLSFRRVDEINPCYQKRFLKRTHILLMEEIRLTSWCSRVFYPITLFPGFYTSQVVQDFFHQQ